MQIAYKKEKEEYNGRQEAITQAIALKKSAAAAVIVGKLFHEKTITTSKQATNRAAIAMHGTQHFISCVHDIVCMVTEKPSLVRMHDDDEKQSASHTYIVPSRYTILQSRLIQ